MLESSPIHCVEDTELESLHTNLGQSRTAEIAGIRSKDRSISFYEICWIIMANNPLDK